MRPQQSPQQARKSDAAKRRAYDQRMSGVNRDFEGMGRPAIHMDYGDMMALFDRYPEMDPAANPDPENRSKYWLKWMKGSASEPYRLRTKL